jgi:hypothetical protein
MIGPSSALGLILPMLVSAPGTTPDILVSIVMHNEEPPGYPNFVQNPTIFWQHRIAVVQFAGMLHDHGVMFNYQSDWNFLKAIGLYDTGTPSTNGKNLLRYLREDLGFEVDPHAHETQYNYADVAYLIQAAGVPPSHTVGGMIVSPPESSILEQFWQPITGDIFPSYSWQAEILWGGGTSLHQNEQPLWTSGVWHPKDRFHFLEHDSAAPLPNVGNYGSNWVNLDRLLTMRSAGQLRNRIHTCTIMAGQKDLLISGFMATFQSTLESHIAGGGCRWVGLAEVIDIWQTEYASVPSLLSYDNGYLLSLGDLDTDGDADSDDVAIFVDVLLGLDGDPGHVLVADLDDSGTADGLDIQPFVDTLLSP